MLQRKLNASRVFMKNHAQTFGTSAKNWKHQSIWFIFSEVSRRNCWCLKQKEMCFLTVLKISSPESSSYALPPSPRKICSWSSFWCFSACLDRAFSLPTLSFLSCVCSWLSQIPLCPHPLKICLTGFVVYWGCRMPSHSSIFYLAT